METALHSLFDYLNAGVSPFHAVAQTAARLEAAGFTRLEETAPWQLERPGKYYLTRNGSSLLAFCLPREEFSGWRLSAAHSDTPTLRVKPAAGRTLQGWQRLAVEPYGGLILSSWLDRPLGLAGRVLVRTGTGVESRLVKSGGPLCVIPSLCAHFDEARGKGRALNPAADLQPVWAPDTTPAAWLAAELGVAEEDLLDTDLTLYPLEEARQVGQLFTSPRIDDLECAWACLEGFLAGKEEMARVFCLFDNEEVGSSTRQGAQSSFLAQVLGRVHRALGLDEDRQAALLAGSLLLSADNGHAAHPNHPEKADPENPVLLGKGPVLKYSANQRYTTSGLTGALVREIFARAEVPCQSFTNRADLPGGSTLGNLLGQTVSIPMADIGAPQWAMHSAVETAHTGDALNLRRALAAFYRTPAVCTKDGCYTLG